MFIRNSFIKLLLLIDLSTIFKLVLLNEVLKISKFLDFFITEFKFLVNFKISNLAQNQSYNLTDLNLRNYTK